MCGCFCDQIGMQSCRFVGFLVKEICQKQRIKLVHNFNSKFGNWGKARTSWHMWLPAASRTAISNASLKPWYQGCLCSDMFFCRKVWGLCCVPTNPWCSFWKDACWVWELTIHLKTFIKSFPGCSSAGKHQDNKQLFLKAQNAHPAIKDWLVRLWDSSHCLCQGKRKAS